MIVPIGNITLCAMILTMIYVLRTNRHTYSFVALGGVRYPQMDPSINKAILLAIPINTVMTIIIIYTGMVYWIRH